MTATRTIGKAVAGLSFGMLFAFLAAAAGAQAERGKAELKVGSEVMTVDYGRPSLKGRETCCPSCRRAPSGGWA